jgi:hypothetical protein
MILAVLVAYYMYPYVFTFTRGSLYRLSPRAVPTRFPLPRPLGSVS